MDANIIAKPSLGKSRRLLPDVVPHFASISRALKSSSRRTIVRGVATVGQRSLSYVDGAVVSGNGLVIGVLDVQCC